MEEFIKVRGAREHNLKNLDIDIPKNKLVVFTGVSGSGKSSLVFDTIYAEGQRRYVESLSAYARQFLGVMDKPEVERIEGLSPAIAIDQKSVSHNPRSTVGTITEIYDYLRLLFARIGHPHCPLCQREISKQTPNQIADSILSQSGLKASRRGIRILILAPVVRSKKGEFNQLFANLKKQGYSKVRVDGQVRNLEEDFGLIRTNQHNIDVVTDRLILRFKKESPSGEGDSFKEIRSRLIQSIEAALRLASGNVVIAEVKDSSFDFPEYPKDLRDHLYSENFACPQDFLSLPEIEPRSFSFNSPQGACPRCTGIGYQLKVDPELVANGELSIDEGGILPWTKILEHDSWFSRLLTAVAQELKISTNQPIKDLPDSAWQTLLFGSEQKSFLVSGANRFGQLRRFEEKFEGVIPNLERRYRETESDYVRREIEKYMVRQDCPACQGSRLKKEALSITILGQNIVEVTTLSITEFKDWLKKLAELPLKEMGIAKTILKEIGFRVDFLANVGLGYLTLSRESRTLAGGEAQRIRLASQIGSGLSGVVYCLDEPSIGLHARDQRKLIETLKRLRDLGNSILVVEHDPQTIRAADYLVDIGPGAGEAGGQVVSAGTPKAVMTDPRSLTGQYLSGRRKINLGTSLKTGSDPKIGPDTNKKIVLRGCQEHNLKNINVSFPLGSLTVVTGVSGSGKSTLVNETLYRAIRHHLGLKETEKTGKYLSHEGFENVDKIINIDQSPIGRTPRSNPVTYIKTFDEIRKLFSLTPMARLKGFSQGRFSFNVKGGRCEACLGDGQIKIEMQFLPDVYVKCETCQGQRYNDETLEVTYDGKNIHEILAMTVAEALEFFNPLPAIVKGLSTLWQVGLGYVKLGQSATTLSGGEAQRVKLAAELSKRPTGKTLYLLDEPTTGLHFADLEKLIRILKSLVARGNTVIVIEHNLSVIAAADYVIDLGLEGGQLGGQVIASGTLPTLRQNKISHTARALRQYKG